MNFVNYAGQPVSIDSTLHARPKVQREERSFHSGWRVVGIKPGEREEAMALAKRNKVAWDEDRWLMSAKRAAVRSKPYEVPQAAQECKALAERAGWLRCEILEIKKEVRTA
jgi:hypothetical protein